MKKYGGKNEAHMKAAQDFRKSNFSGFHDPNKKQKNKKKRKEAKKITKSFVDFFVYL